MGDIKSIFASKLFWANVAAIASALALYFETGNTEALGTAALGAINIVLRYFTSTGVRILPPREG